LELRKTIKQLKLENYKLHQRLDAEEEIEVTYKMNSDLEKMSPAELKNKILKLA